MKKNYLMLITIIVFAVDYFLLLLNQITNLKFLGLWLIWNLSGFFWYFIAIPLFILIIISFINSAIFLHQKPYSIKFLILNFSLFVIHLTFLILAFTSDMFAWC